MVSALESVAGWACVSGAVARTLGGGGYDTAASCGNAGGDGEVRFGATERAMMLSPDFNPRLPTTAVGLDT